MKKAKRTHTWARILLITLGALLIAYSLVLMIISNIHVGLFAILLAGGIFLAFGIAHKHIHVSIMVTYYVLVLLAICVMLFLLIYGSYDSSDHTEDAMIILGAGIRGDQPADSLRRRLDAALEYYEKNPDVIFVVSGGQGPQEDITEAEAMRRYLTARSVPDTQIILEDRATSTAENLAYSKELLDSRFPDGYSVAFVTNDYHVYRSGLIAGKCGYSDISHIHADSPLYLLIPNVTRELLATLKEWVF